MIYVWPQRLLTKTADEDNDEANQRHYRDPRDVIWYPHPSYHLKLEVIINQLKLVLKISNFNFNKWQNGSSWGRLDFEQSSEDDNFVATAKVQLIDESSNTSSLVTEKLLQPLRSCFYQGRLQGDPGSKAVLSLCNGLVIDWCSF